MRQLKFRAWDKEEKSWIPPGELAIDGRGVVLTLDTDEWMVEVLSLEVMQFTGLLDKNEKEIYESDIVRVVNGSGGFVDTTVIWFEHGWGLRRIDNKDIWNLRQWDYDDCGIKVIGNVYENPELLK